MAMTEAQLEVAEIPADFTTDTEPEDDGDDDCEEDDTCENGETPSGPTIILIDSDVIEGTMPPVGSLGSCSTTCWGVKFNMTPVSQRSESLSEEASGTGRAPL